MFPLPTISTAASLYLLNVIVGALAISAAGLLAARLTRGRPAVAHALLLSALLGVLVCPLALAMAGWYEVGAVGVAVAPAKVFTDSSRGPSANEATPAIPPTQDAIGRAAVEVDHAAERTEASAAVEHSQAWLPALMLAVAIVWFAGSLWMLGGLVRGMALLGRLRRSLAPCDEPRLRSLAAEAFGHLGIRRDVELCTSPLVPGPLTLGIRRAAIVLPEGLAEELSDDELACVLAHEAAHVARQDAAVALAEQAALVAYWWNPPLRAVVHRLRGMREALCDDHACALLGDGDRVALALVRIAEWCQSRPACRLGAALRFETDDLSGRVFRLTEGVQAMNRHFRVRCVAGIGLLAGALTACLLVPALRAVEPGGAREPTFRSAGVFRQTKAAAPRRLSYNDGKADGRRSVAGAGEMVLFTLPEGETTAEVQNVRIHGSRYGYPQPPQEDFLVYFLNEDMSETLATEMVPYARFERGEAKWVTIRLAKPVEVPEKFWVCVDFRAERTKGVYVSIDKSTDGSHSRLGLPGAKTRPANVGGDWMIETVLAK